MPKDFWTIVLAVIVANALIAASGAVFAALCRIAIAAGPRLWAHLTRH